MYIEVRLDLRNAQEMQAFAQFTEFLDKKRNDEVQAAIALDEQQEAAPDVAHEEDAVEVVPVDVGAIEARVLETVTPASVAQPAATTADVIALVRSIETKNIPHVLTVLKEFGVKRASEIKDEQAEDFLSRFRALTAVTA